MIEEGKVRSLTAGQMKALRRFIWFLMIVVVIGGIAALDNLYERHNPELPYAAAQKQARDPMSVVRHVTINGQALTIPVPYFMPFAPADGEQETILLAVLYPEFEPLKESPSALHRKGRWFDHVRILLSSHEIRRSGEPIVTRKTITEMYAFFIRNLHASPETIAHNGLQHHVPRDKGYGDLYRISQNGDEFIECSPSGGTNPQCSLWMSHKGVQLQVSFDKDLLPHWRDIRDKTGILLDGFK